MPDFGDDATNNMRRPFPVRNETPVHSDEKKSEPKEPKISEPQKKQETKHSNPKELPVFRTQKSVNMETVKESVEKSHSDRNLIENEPNGPYISKDRYKAILRNFFDSHTDIQSIQRHLGHYAEQIKQEQNEIQKLADTMYSVNQEVLNIDKKLFETGEFQ